MATETAKPFDGTPIATAAEFRRRNRRAVPDMVDAHPGASTLQVTAPSGGTSISIADGRAIVQGALYELSDGPLTLEVPANETGASRTDYAVLTYDEAHTPGVYARVLAGTALTRNPEGVWDFPLASWFKTAAGAVTTPFDWRQFRGSEVQPCTSLLRPLDPTLGQLAYEADTGQHIRWNGLTWDPILQDTGWVNLNLTGATAGPNANSWTNNNVSRVRRRNGHVHLRLALRRWNDFGLGIDDADGSVPFILPAQFRPEVIEVGSGYHSRSPIVVRVEPEGPVRIYPLETNMPAARTLIAAVDYLV